MARPKKDQKLKDIIVSKPGKYFLARQTGKNKKESALTAGYADGQHITQIESSLAYNTLTNYFKDELLAQTNLKELAGELLKNIKQDKDRGAKNKAIEIALSKIEPDKIQPDDSDKVLVILR